MYNPEKLSTLGTQDEDKQKTTQKPKKMSNSEMDTKANRTS